MRLRGVLLGTVASSAVVAAAEPGAFGMHAGVAALSLVNFLRWNPAAQRLHALSSAMFVRPLPNAARLFATSSVLFARKIEGIQSVNAISVVMFGRETT